MGQKASKIDKQGEEPKRSPSPPRRSRPIDGAVGGVRISKGVKHSITIPDLPSEAVEETSHGQTLHRTLSERNESPKHNSFEDVLRLRRTLGNQQFRREYTQTIIERKKSSALLVAAIDFGTTYSGYSYSYFNKPKKVLTNYWGNASLKTPTVVLMNPRQQFHSFGEDAREKYENLMKTGEHKDWYLFERFKMKLFVKETPLDRDMEIEDILGKPMKAIEVFAAAIGYIRKHLLSVLNNPDREDHVEIKSDNDIRWVLTVPAIWNDLSKQFMREAAVKAGIPDEMLLLALEPEAASLFCKEDLGLRTVPVGSKYLVLDLGGGTADITCHEVNQDGTLKELHPPTGGDFGGTSVDNEFLNLLYSIFGATLIAEYKQYFLNEYWELLKRFELKKRNFDGTGRVILKFPVDIVRRHENIVGETVEDTVKCSPLSDTVEFRNDKLIISETRMKQFFNKAVSQIKEKTEEILERISEEIDIILLVGGFSESVYLQKVMKENFHNLIDLPKEPSGAVLKGAVIYGHETKAISSRKCRYTYGIARMIKFIPGKHPEKKKIRMDDFTFCDDVFNKHIEIGTEVSVNTPERAKAHEYYPSVHNQKLAVLEVYKSNRKDPMFIDEDGCELVGLIKVNIDPKGDIWSKLLVKLIFGGTELKVEVKDETNAQVTTGTVDFLG